MKNILFVDIPKKINEVYTDTVRERLGLDKIYTAKDLGSVDFSDVECIFSTWYMPHLSKEEIREYFPSLRAVFYAAGTVKYFAKEYLELGIKVYSAESANAVPVAEFAYAEILLALKGYYRAASLYKHRFFRRAKAFAEAHRGVYSANVGIIGAGNIGRLTIEHLRRHDVNIYVYDKYLSKEEIEALGAKSVTLSELLSSCDVVSNHIPDTAQTRDALGFYEFISMKPNATFINTGRGRQVEERGLCRAMKKRPDLSAVLDVARHEPPWPWSGLYRRKNIFLTPHIAGSLGAEQNRMAEYMEKAYEMYNTGDASMCEVKLDMLENMSYDR